MVQEPPGALTKTQVAFHRIRAAIEEGRLRPGDRLRMAALQEELGMSPTPIREALRLLQAQGSIEHQPHRGMVVAEYSGEEAEEVYRLRMVLEPMAAELAADRATDEQLEHIRRRHALLKAAVESGNARVDIADLNADWHRAIYAAAGSRYLQEFIDRLWSVLPLEVVWVGTHSKSSVEKHERITSALEHRDASGATALMRDHIETGAGEAIKRLFGINDTSFEEGGRR